MNKIYTYTGLNELAGHIPQNSGVFVIIDNNLKHYSKYFEMFNVININSSEKAKTLSTVEYIINRLLELNADRNCFIIGVGGGITTDITGFVASIYKRGVKFGFVPTTLLAQVDASIGGKNGVNFHSYKNIIGVINQPEWIYVCSDVLKTLHHKEFRAGIAEVFKTFILFDREYYKKAVEYFRELNKITSNSPDNLINSPDNNEIYKQDTLTDIIGKCAQYKCVVVERDEFERGERRLLNLGHTFAHAIEKLCTETAEGGIMHGEAVSIGLVLAAKVAALIAPTECDKDFAKQLKKELAEAGLPVEIPNNLKMKDLVDAITKDKKVSGNNIHFILPKGIENVEDREVSLKKLEELSGDLC